MRRNMILIMVVIVIALVSFALAACDDAGSGRSYGGSQGSQISYDDSPVIVTGKGFYSPDCVDETGWSGCAAEVMFEVSGAYCVMAPPHPDYGTNAVNGFVRIDCGGRIAWFSANNVVRR